MQRHKRHGGGLHADMSYNRSMILIASIVMTAFHPGYSFPQLSKVSTRNGRS